MTHTKDKDRPPHSEPIRYHNSTGEEQGQHQRPAHLRARELLSFKESLSRSGMSEEGFIGAITSTALSRLSSWNISDLERLLSASLRHDLDPTTGREVFLVPDESGGAPHVVVSVDGWSRIINQHQQFAGIRFKEATQQEGGVPAWVECTIHRWDRRVPTTVREYLSEVQGLSQAWLTHPRRMLRHKALVQCARIAFGLGDIYDADEASRVSSAKSVSKPASHKQPEGGGRKAPLGVAGLRSTLGV